MTVHDGAKGPPKKKAGLPCEEVDGETLVYDPDRNQVHFLNPSAALVWKLCDGAHGADEMTAEVTATFDVAADRARGRREDPRRAPSAGAPRMTGGGRREEPGPGLRVEALSTSVTVRSGAPRLIDDLKGLLRFFRLTDLPPGTTDDAGLTVVSESDPHGLALRRDGELVLRSENYGYTLASLEYEVSRALLERARGHLLIHAGAVAVGEVGIVLPGGRSVGKTTLVAFLVKNGFRYYSDETAAVACRSMELAPFPRPLGIKGRTPALLGPTGGKLEVGRYGGPGGDYEGAYALPSPELVGRGPVDIGLVVFPSYSPGARTGLTRVSKGEAALDLLRGSLNLGRVREDGFGAAAAVARRAESYRLVYENVDEALEEIRRLADGLCRRSGPGRR
jgi:hypothetical protein